MSETAQSLTAIKGAPNFRDLGGLPCPGSRQTRHGMLFRSSSLQFLSADEAAFLKSGLGVVTVIDLRTKTEVNKEGCGLLRPMLRWRHIPVIERLQSVENPSGLVKDVARRYAGWIEQGSERIAEIVTQLADPAMLPAVFHCAAGKDRTGVVAAMLLSLLEVDPAAIIADYVLSAIRIDRVVAGFASSSLYAASMEGTPEGATPAKAEWMSGFLEFINMRYGGAREWARSSGVDDRAIKALRDALLEPVSRLDGARDAALR